MSTLSQFLGSAATKGIVFMADGWTAAQSAHIQNAPTIAFGALTANVYKDLLTINGKGWLDFLSYWSNSATSRVVTLKITIDGTIVLTTTSGTITTGSNYGRVFVGMQATSGQNHSAHPLRFNSSLVVAVKDTTGGTIDQNIDYLARTE